MFSKKLIELLEPRRLLSGAVSAAVSDDLAVIRADHLKLHFDQVQLNTVARVDEANTKKVTSADRKAIRVDLVQLHSDENLDPPGAITEALVLESAEQKLASDIRVLAGTARSDRAAVLLQLSADDVTCLADVKQYHIDRRAGA